MRDAAQMCLFDYSRPLFNRYRSRKYAVMGCDSFVCHYPGVVSDFQSIHARMMYLLHKILSEHQQIPSPICQFGTQG